MIRKLTTEEKIAAALDLQSTKRFIRLNFGINNPSFEKLTSPQFKNKVASWDIDKKSLFYRNLTGIGNYKEIKNYYEKTVLV